MHRFRHLLLIGLALTAAVMLAACGGGGGGDENPQQVLDQTFSNDQSIDSGVFDLSLKIEAQGGDQPGNVNIHLNGPFDGQGSGVPKFDVNADVSADTGQGNISFNGALVSTGDAAYVNFQGTDYSVPQQLFDQFTSTYAQIQQQSNSQADQSGNFLKQLGIDPSTWLTDLSNDGTEDVDGTETTHVSGSANVPRLLEDLQTAAEKAGPAASQQLTPNEINQIKDSVKSADLDVYSGTDDHLLRKLSANLEITPPAGSAGAPDSLSVDFSITLSDVNNPQEISAPANAQPLSGLLQQFGIDPNQLGGALRGGLGSVPQSGGSTTPPSSSSSQAYLQCLQSAQGASAIQACASLLQ